MTYADIGGCKEQIERMREVVELPMLHPERFVALGIDPPKGVLCYGPPGGRLTWSHRCLPASVTTEPRQISPSRVPDSAIAHGWHVLLPQGPTTRH